jgi:hypothetical protein
MEHEMYWWLNQPIQEPWHPQDNDRAMYLAIMNGELSPPQM